MARKVLLLDTNHDLLETQLTQMGYQCIPAWDWDEHKIMQHIGQAAGLVVRSRIPINAQLLQHAAQLKFIARVGAGMEGIDAEAAQRHHIQLINAPEGNRDALAEYCIGGLLSVMRHFQRTANQIEDGIWLREQNRGDEIMGKTIGLIGYGNMGKAFAQRLRGFDCEVIFHEIKPGLQDANAQQVSLEQLQHTADVLSLHIPLNADTHYLIDEAFIARMQKPFYLINTARGKNLRTSAAVQALQSGKIKGAVLDVLEYEKSSFESLQSQQLPADFNYLVQAENVILTPHIAGWTHESKVKLAQTIVSKIGTAFSSQT
ncbi:MAG: NAD(P)-dependent oxidoreductase [Weeksellaceae bacterium]|nr:NAD(P)-dependent oxidoreductase [Weeksellaceae bacterium]